MTEVGVFKNSPVIILKRSEDDKYPFSFGVAKAKMILQNIEDIKKFVDDQDHGHNKQQPEPF